MANLCRNIMLLVSILCIGISMCGAIPANTKTAKLPWDAKSMPNHPQQFSIPPKRASIDPDTLKELVEFQEIVTEGVPLLLRLFNRLMKNKFAKPLVEVLLTCDKQNFMVSCVQGIFQKVIGILTGQPKQAQPNSNDGIKKSHDHLQPHMKDARVQPSKTDEDDDVNNVQRSDDNEIDATAKSEKNRVTGDSDTKVESESSGEENATHPVKPQHPHTPLGPTSADHKSEL